MANACRVDGDVRSRGTARFDNQAAVVGGSVSVSAGDAALVPGTAVGGGVTASGTVTWDQCPARCTPGTAVPHPPAEAFPLLTWNSTTEAAWASAGWTQVVTRSDCTLLGDANEPGRWLLDNAGSLSARTILRTPCQVVLQPNNGTLALGHDLAIVADGGIRFAGTLTVRSATATARSLYLLQPTNAVTSPCALDGVQLDNQVFVDPTVTDLVYSPCNVRIANASAHNGQMYAGGTLIFDNAVTMTFRPMDLHGIPGTAPTQTYRVDILTKRENT
jgi:hypothetical protein